MYKVALALRQVARWLLVYIVLRLCLAASSLTHTLDMKHPVYIQLGYAYRQEFIILQGRQYYELLISAIMLVWYSQYMPVCTLLGCGIITVNTLHTIVHYTHIYHNVAQHVSIFRIIPVIKGDYSQNWLQQLRWHTHTYTHTHTHTHPRTHTNSDLIPPYTVCSLTKLLVNHITFLLTLHPIHTTHNMHTYPSMWRRSAIKCIDSDCGVIILFCNRTWSLGLPTNTWMGSL